jgi:hypothetical protein
MENALMADSRSSEEKNQQLDELYKIRERLLASKEKMIKSSHKLLNKIEELTEKRSSASAFSKHLLDKEIKKLNTQFEKEKEEFKQSGVVTDLKNLEEPIASLEKSLFGKTLDDSPNPRAKQNSPGL